MQAGTKVNGDIAPKSNVVEAADLIPLWGRQNHQDAYWQVSWGASGVRTAGMQSRDLVGTREIRQAPRFGGVGIDKLIMQG